MKAFFASEEQNVEVTPLTEIDPKKKTDRPDVRDRRRRRPAQLAASASGIWLTALRTAARRTRLRTSGFASPSERARPSMIASIVPVFASRRSALTVHANGDGVEPMIATETTTVALLAERAELRRVDAAELALGRRLQRRAVDARARGRHRDLAERDRRLGRARVARRERGGEEQRCE